MFYRALGKNTGRHTIEYSDCVASVYSCSEIGGYIYVFTECSVKCFVCRLYVLFLLVIGKKEDFNGICWHLRAANISTR